MSMPESAIILLAAVAVLLLKHMVADFFLQTPFQYLNKGTYGHPGGLLHSGIHVALTPLVYLVIAPMSLLLAVWLTLGEFAVNIIGVLIDLNCAIGAYAATENPSMLNFEPMVGCNLLGQVG